jgi:hypothetical protein
MKTWTVETIKTQIVYFKVEAETEDEAMKKWAMADFQAADEPEYEVIMCYPYEEEDETPLARPQTYDAT